MKTAHERKFELPFHWPDPPFEVALVEPQIPPNTGNVARLCAATRTPLHLVDPMGFDITDRNLRRAGLDYWESVQLTRHAGLADFLEYLAPRPYYLFSTAGEISYFEVEYAPGTVLVFGNETEGLPDALLEEKADRVVQIPILTEHVRSLNLGNSASIALYEALRQAHFSMGKGAIAGG